MVDSARFYKNLQMWHFTDYNWLSWRMENQRENRKILTVCSWWPWLWQPLFRLTLRLHCWVPLSRPPSGWGGWRLPLLRSSSESLPSWLLNKDRASSLPYKQEVWISYEDKSSWSACCTLPSCFWRISKATSSLWEPPPTTQLEATNKYWLSSTSDKHSAVKQIHRLFFTVVRIKKHTFFYLYTN